MGFGKERGEYVAGSAVACIMVDADMRVTLPGGTNDQGKADLNGEPVFRFEKARTLEKDATAAPQEARAFLRLERYPTLFVCRD